MRTEEEIEKYLSKEIRFFLKDIDLSRNSGIQEIRLRANRPLMVHNRKGDWFVDMGGNLCKRHENLCMIRQEDIINTLNLMSENSVYAFQEEIKNGYITLKGGHRVGIAGKTVVEKDMVKNIKEISGLNIRLAKEVKGCSDRLLEYILSGNQNVLNTLIISPPQCGKTTIIRDVARNLSDGSKDNNFKGIKVGIVDERSEIAACFKGVAQFDVGLRTDVLDACPKAAGMIMLVRSMSPDVIIVDEIGNRGDKDAVMSVINAGVKIIATAHGYSIQELKTRREVLELVDERVFERFIVLNNSEGPGTLSEVMDGEKMEVLYDR